jgi:hypothetical protein
MLKELFKRWFGNTEPQKESEVADKQINKYKTFGSIEEYKTYILKHKKDRTNKQLAKLLNRKGYRTVKGLQFTDQTVYMYLQDHESLVKRRDKSRDLQRKLRKLKESQHEYQTSSRTTRTNSI